MRPAAVGFHCPDDVALGRRATRPARTAVGGRLRTVPPYVTVALIAANVVIYLITGLQSPAGIDNPTASGLHTLFYDWQLQPAAVYHDHSYWRLLTSAFLHVSLLHIASNMLALAVIGPSLEHVLGRWRYLTVYLLSALGGSAAIYAFGSPLEPVVGASGAIFGLFGASLVMVRRLGLDLQWLVGVIVLNFVFTFSISGISRLAHVGGFVTGILAGVAIAGLPRVTGRIGTNRQVAALAGLLVLVVLTVVGKSAAGV